MTKCYSRLGPCREKLEPTATTIPKISRSKSRQRSAELRDVGGAAAHRPQAFRGLPLFAQASQPKTPSLRGTVQRQPLDELEPEELRGSSFAASAPLEVGGGVAKGNQRQPPPSSLDPLVKGVGTSWAPEAIELPAKLRAAMEKVWEEAPMKVAGKILDREHGGILIQDEQQNYDFRPGTPSQTSGNWTPNYEDVGDDFLAVVGHVHPTQKGQSKWGLSFSDRDVAKMASAPESVQVVKSEDRTFVLAKSLGFRQRTEPLTFEQLAQLETEMETAYQRVHAQIPGDAATKAHHTTRIIAARYGLLYYTGRGNRLRRVV